MSWEQSTLGSLSNDISYGLGSPSKKYDGCNKYLRITDIDEISNKFIYDDLTSPDCKLEDYYLLKENDLLFARTGASTGKTYLYSLEDGIVYFAGFLIRFRLKNVDSKFVFYQTKTSKYNKWVNVYSKRSGQSGINANEYSKLKIGICCHEEQNKISNFLSILDKKIENLSNKINTLKKYKEGLMQVNFKIQDCIKLGLLLKESTIKTKTSNEHKILSSTAAGLFLQKDYFNHQVASENNIGYKIVKKGQLLFSPQNLWLGNINLNNKYDIGIVSPSYKVFSIRNDINKEWFISFLKTKRMLYNYRLVSEQGASVVRRNLNMEQLMSQIIPIPENQHKIGAALKMIDLLIQKEMNNLSQLTSYKMYLLNNMFI